MIDFTTVIAVDQHHAVELETVWPTWRLHRPELLRHPMLVICDGVRTRRWWWRRLAFLDHPSVCIVKWSLPGVDQREKMLSAFVLAAPFLVESPWYLKLDTDVVAVPSSRKWIEEAWFTPDERGQVPVFIASPWGYTKPADAIECLDRWAVDQPVFSDHPPLNLSPVEGADKVCHSRITSWCFFGRTDWTRDIARLCNGRLPVPSQDTFLWYCAARSGAFYRRVRMAQVGWKHVTRGPRRLRDQVRESLKSEKLIESAVDREATSMLPHTQTILSLVDSLKNPDCVVAEVGVAEGKTSRQLLTACPRLQLLMIDGWQTYAAEHPYAISGDRCAALSQADQDARAAEAERSTAFASNRRTIFRCDSASPPTVISDHSLDLAFIDADHTYEAVARDIRAWWPKVRTGGILAGHDYGGPRDKRGIWGVAKAVDEFSQRQQLTVTVGAGHVWSVQKPRDRIDRVELPCPTNSNQSRGVVYLLTQPTHAARLVVSLYSLRKFYTGPVTVFSTHPVSAYIADLCAEDPVLRIEHRSIRLARQRRNATYLTKVAMLSEMPYRHVLYLDADTLLVGDITELFQPLEEQPLCVTQFANWTTHHRKIRTRLDAWNRIDEHAAVANLEKLVLEAKKHHPAINIGVFAFDSQADFLQPWYELAQVGSRTFICDEIALQLLLPTYSYRLFDCRFNCSPVYARSQSDVRVWHFHGDKHLGRPNIESLWIPTFRDCVREDIARIQSWLPAHDVKIERFLQAQGGLAGLISPQ